MSPALTRPPVPQTTGAPLQGADPELPLSPVAPQEGIEALREDVPAPFSEERDERTSLLDDLSVQTTPGAPNPTTGQQTAEIDPITRKAMESLYGTEFPLLDAQADEPAWCSWASQLWDRHRAGVQYRLHTVRRNRLFRKGIQWISSTGVGVWREPAKPRDAVRAVHNMVSPALDQRSQLVIEQRPGFKTRPENHDSLKQRRAEAQQVLLEYEYDQQDLPTAIAACSYWAGTDGVAFLELFWDADRGPWGEEYVPNGKVDQQGNAEMEQRPAPAGDVYHRVRRIEQVRVSANSSSSKPPDYMVVRDVISRAEAIARYGKDIADMDDTGETPRDTDGLDQFHAARLGYTLASEEELLREQDTIQRFTVYCRKSEFLPKGLTLIVVGKKIVFQGPLIFGCIPVARFTDGSTDPAYFCEPQMDRWIDSQMRVNAVLSKWVENVRINSTPRLLAKEHGLSTETLISGTMSVIGVKGLGNITDLVKPIEGFSLAPDAIKLLEFEKKSFEDLSGWNDVSRGQFTQDQSGRAILAIREQLERIFAPTINAAAKFMVDWSKITLAVCAWGFDGPRSIGVMGQGRPDLARLVSADDFDGVIDVMIDPETLMPMPRSLRLFFLKDLLAMGQMSPQEFRRRSPFGYIREISTPDEDQEARARRCVDAMRQGSWLPILWQDDEAIHQDILQRDLILPDDTDPQIRQMAAQRWMMLAQQSMMKMGVVPMQGGAGGGPQGPPGQGPKQPGAQLPSDSQPFQGTSPGVSTTQGGVSDQSRAANQFDQTSGL